MALSTWHDFGFSDSWLADDLSTGAVSSWSNGQGGTALSQGTGADQPTQAATSGPSSQPGVTFDGTSDYLQAAIGTKSQPQTYVWVGKYLSLTAFDWFFDSSDGAGSNRNLFGVASGGATWELYAGTIITGGTADTNFHAGLAYYNGASTVLELDNTTIISGSTPGTQSLGTGLTMGARYDGGSGWGNIVVSAFGVYNGDARTDLRWQELVNYTYNKWGLELGYPGTYKPSPVSGTISSTGITKNIIMFSDE